jgi:hypothetical protein
MNPKELFTRVMDDMVRAGWLHSHIFTEGKGHHLVWSMEGIPKGIFIRMIAERAGLDSGDEAPVGFDILCRGGSLPAGLGAAGETDPEIASVWRELVDELGYAGDADSLLGMVHVCMGWAVDGDTDVRIGH